MIVTMDEIHVGFTVQYDQTEAYTTECGALTVASNMSCAVIMLSFIIKALEFAVVAANCH
jgi:hypothetical protein